MIDRSRPLFDVKIEGVPAEWLGSFGAVVKSVRYEEGEDIPDTVTVEIINATEKLISDPKVAEGTVLNVSIGYEEDMYDLGRFRLRRPIYSFPETGHIAFAFRGERESEARLSFTEVRRQFKNRTDSEIVEIITREQGLETTTKDAESGKMVSTITSTTKRPESVTISKKTWIEFLHERAKLYGFQVWITDEEHGSVLHFGPIVDNPILDDKGKRLQLEWSTDKKSSLKSFSVRDDESGKATEVVSTGVDPKTGAGFKQKGNPVPKTGGAQVKQPRPGRIEKIFKIVRGAAGIEIDPEKGLGFVTGGARDRQFESQIKQPRLGRTERIYGAIFKAVKGETTTLEESEKEVRKKGSGVTSVVQNALSFLDEGMAESIEMAKQIAEAKSQASAWSISGTAVPVIGLPFIRKNKTILLAGISRFSTKYLITGTSHFLDESRYDLSFEVKTFKSQKPMADSKKKQTRKSVVTKKPGLPPAKKDELSKDVAKPGRVMAIFNKTKNSVIEVRRQRGGGATGGW